jgi:L-lactate dehydrogenase complex protein LldE
MSRTVQLFITCIIDALYPEIGEAVVRVLRRAGTNVDFQPGQTCCGQPAFNAGMRIQARDMAKHTIATFERAPGMVVLPSGSCTAMIRHGYPELFDGDPAWAGKANALAERTFEFSEYLVDVLGIVDLGAKWKGPITYHASCHLLRELGVSRQPRLLLEAIKGAEIVELPQAEECCGFGGVFSVEHPELSASMLERKLSNIEYTGAPTVVSCDAGCLTHINGGFYRRGSGVRGKHIAELLDQIGD